ncbi:DUF2062 domain-containing protein [Sinorhizobium sp. BG8]|uniref:DUF2062 domain-containing protein n=1 Tax=Sinorhizobium sp. BG8 TaxID=2613773 RepID=UPI00193E8EF3|nr:DUF2062 domain-containing protein [Sinorhizobium sp. BG8]QRM54816.1 DUF2062 domain-containing protein [Sinorhizobium sp. BG8]
MLFRRRNPPTLRERLRALFWPRKGLVRPFRYIGKRILRLGASPHAVAVGVAAGVFSTFTPFVGLHIVIACAIAYALAGNLLASALTTALGNPITFPLIWLATFRVGDVVLGTGVSGGQSSADLVHMLEHLEFTELWQPVLKPMLVGTLVLGSAAGIAAYALTLIAMRAFRKRRRLRIAERVAPQRATTAGP